MHPEPFLKHVPACDFLKIDSKHKQPVKWPLNEVEPMVFGLSAKRTFD
jgi:hypothetical protein